MKCKGETKTGERCSAPIMKGSSFCFFHNPKVSSKEKAQARIKGGKGNRIYLNQINIDSENIWDLLQPKIIVDIDNAKKLQAVLIEWTLTKQIDMSTSTKVSYMIAQYTKMHELSLEYKRLQGQKTEKSIDESKELDLSKLTNKEINLISKILDKMPD